MSCSNFSSGASRRVLQTSSSADASTSYASSWGREYTRRTRPLRAASTFAASASIFAVKTCFPKTLLASDRAGALDLLLQLDDPVDQCFSRGRTPRHVHIHGHDAIAATHDRVRIVVVAATIRARTHRDDPARFRHLVVDLAERGGHFVDQC